MERKMLMQLQLMDSDCIQTLHGALGHAFLTAMLLTQSPARAEDAVREAILSWNPDEAGDAALVHGTVQASLNNGRESASTRQEDVAEASALLPVELREILKLSRPSRNCLVLRILAGMSRDVCARLLQLSICEVDDHTSNALYQLAAPRAE
jgi:DNA-directed RNA polymerase specialized sigma24 family protein